MSIYFIHSKDSVSVDFSMFNYKNKNCYVSYENHWEKPNGEKYIKYTKFPVSGQFGNHLNVGDFNNYGHVLRKIEKVLVYARKN